MSSLRSTFQFLNRLAGGSFAASVVLFAYKKHFTRSKPASSDATDGHGITIDGRKLPPPRSWIAEFQAIARDTAMVWSTGALICFLNQKVMRAMLATALRRRSSARSSVVETLAQFGFGVATSVLLQRLDTKRWRQGIFAGLCINSGFEAAYQLVFGQRKRLGLIFLKLTMAVVGAQLSHAFILAPFAMSSSDLRFFRLASGHSADRHDRVVRATKGALRFDDLSPTTVVNQECDNDQSRKSSSQPHSENCSDTFCNLVHPGQHDCMHAALPSFQRALKMACLLYTPFLALQIVRALAAGKLTRTRAKGAVTSYARLVCFLTTFSGLVQWLPCLFARIVPSCNHSTRWLYFVSGFVSSGLAAMWDSSNNLRSITLMLLPRAIQSAILEPPLQKTFMRWLTAVSLGFLFALGGGASPKAGGMLASMVRSVQGRAS